MREIQRDKAVAEGGAPIRRPSRKLGWAALPVLAGGLALALVLPTGGGPADQRGKAAPAATSPMTAPVSATALLDQAADVAAGTPVVTVGTKQFAYVKSLVQDSQIWTDSHMVPTKVVTGPPRERQTWSSADGSQPGLVIDPQVRPETKFTTDPIKDPSLKDPTSAYVATLPTDPDVLLKKIYDEATVKDKSPDVAAFVEIGTLLREQIAPPQVSAALFRAAGRISGVTVVDDVTDATGRHGVAVARQAGDVQWQWIFDSNSHEFLGERQVVTKAGPYGKVGDILLQAAVEQRAAVDQAGEQPKG
ncbi:CU044_5270 family protein [Kitasatospora sp. RB6PN24]|nr:CU044_5270 family protein [Kitasatospora humi]